MEEELVTRQGIVEVLQRWQAGLWTAKQVHDWAEGRYTVFDVDDWEEQEEEEINSVAMSVLSDLDKLDMDLMIVEDVPIYLQFLGTPPGQFSVGLNEFEEKMSKIDRRQRQQDLSGDPFYARFCQ